MEGSGGIGAIAGDPPATKYYCTPAAPQAIQGMDRAIAPCLAESPADILIER
jgi:hypothetical protein